MSVTRHVVKTETLKKIKIKTAWVSASPWKVANQKGGTFTWAQAMGSRCMHIHLYTCACGCTYALVQAHFVYLYCPISLLHALVLQVFLNTCMLVWGGIGSGVCFSLFMVSACYQRWRLCFGRGRYTGFVLYILLFLRVLGWWVCACTHT